MRFATAGGSVIHFEHVRRGGAPLLVFINSLGTDLRIWDAVVPAFPEFSTLRYDKPGHGLSDLAAGPLTMARLADQLIELTEGAGATDVVLVGLSVGGLIAQAFCERRPDLVRALVLCGTAHKIGTAESWGARIATVERDGIGAIADGVLKLWFTPAFRAGRAEELPGCRNMLVRQPVAGYVATCEALRDTDHTELVRRITAPTLCLVGDGDGSTPPELVRQLAGLVPGAEFRIIADAGHIPCVEQPAALAARIRDFLARQGAMP